MYVTFSTEFEDELLSGWPNCRPRATGKKRYYYAGTVRLTHVVGAPNKGSRSLTLDARGRVSEHYSNKRKWFVNKDLLFIPYKI